MKILTTGAKGQVGSHLLEHLAFRPYQIIALDHDECDITNADVTDDAIEKHRPDLVVNLAAYTNVEAAETSPDLAFLVNAVGAGNVARSSAKINCPIIHLSTDYVFSGGKFSPYCEGDVAEPINQYGKSKLAGELAVKEFNAQHIILRTSWVFSSLGNNFYTKIIELAKKQTSISVVNDQTGGPTFAGDLARTIVLIIQMIEKNSLDVWGEYHYSGEPFVSWFDFAETIFKLDQHNAHVAEKSPELISISSEQYSSKTLRPKNSCLNNQKIFQQFGVEPCNWKNALRGIYKSI